MMKSDNLNKTLFGIFFLTIITLIFLREPCWLIDGSLKGDAFGYYKNGKSKEFLENLFYVYP